MKLLVTYASKYGSTAEIAEVIGKELRKRSYAVDVKPADQVNRPESYDGFVIGSGLYAGSWMKPAATAPTSVPTVTASPAASRTRPTTRALPSRTRRAGTAMAQTP